ncbi:hypothetical protein [Pedobacter frigoris]|uniref:TerB family tellurite resistance protein n=1 Tax=Pedobacter frigoris TaxID=2571272 RepID=A0A4U1CDM0_9SPHI|nr:hypothetical protein [Pedobacter frigoris]TKC04228.1 hypothetical protein FA047_16660 [Pedobacter frigoris]
MGSSRKICGLIVLVALSLQNLSSSAQTWGEIFSQKKTQKKYLLQQIAALQVYIGYAKKGYDIVGSGIHAVKGITNGEFSLHRGFFASLAAVNPNIKNSAAVGEIINSGLGIISVLKTWKASELNAADWGYVFLVKANLLAECATDLEELFVVITSGKLEMKDDERLGRLESIRLSIQDKYDFALAFTADLQMLIRGRAREEESINQIRRLHEVN